MKINNFTFVAEIITVKIGGFTMIRINNSTGFANRSSESFKNILKEASRFPRLSNDEQVRLVSIYQNNPNSEEGVEARNRLIESNIYYIFRIAKWFVYKSEFTIGDLVNQGCIGLITAIGHFNQEQGAKFIGYAANWIYQSIQDFIDKYENLVRLPLNQLTLIRKIEKARSILIQLNEQEPSLKELADELGESVENIRDAMITSGGRLSADSPICDEEDRSDNISELLSDEYYINDAEMLDDSRHTMICETLSRMLAPREQEIIKYAFGLDGHETMSNSQIARIFGITAERVRQIIEASVSKLGKSESLLAYCA